MIFVNNFFIYAIITTILYFVTLMTHLVYRTYTPKCMINVSLIFQKNFGIISVPKACYVSIECQKPASKEPNESRKVQVPTIFHPGMKESKVLFGLEIQQCTQLMNLFSQQATKICLVSGRRHKHIIFTICDDLTDSGSLA